MWKKCKNKSLYHFNNNHHLYILSDEEIREDDYMIWKGQPYSRNFGQHVMRVQRIETINQTNLNRFVVLGKTDIFICYNESCTPERKHCKKIIASTDPSLSLPMPSDSFIKKYLVKKITMKNKLLFKIGFWILVAVLFESIALGISILATYNDSKITILLGMSYFHIASAGGLLFGIIVDYLVKLYYKLYKR